MKKEIEKFFYDLFADYLLTNVPKEWMEKYGR